MKRDRKFYFRLVIFLFVTILSIICLFMTKEEFFYFLKLNDAPVKIGDIQKRKILGLKELNIPHNSFVEMQGLIMTKEAETKKYNYFYCPLYNIIVQTKKPLPEKQYFRIGNLTIPDELTFLIEMRKVFPEDFSQTFSGKGRVLKLSQTGRKYKNLKKYYESIFKIPVNECYLFLEGDTPLSYSWYLIIYAGSAILFLITGGMFFYGLRKRQRIDKTTF